MKKTSNKYEQGGLVLKKKTKDNYGKKANPNDVKVSAGPDFIGEGYTAYNWKSPAWGGQFQDGGIIVNDPKDPRIKKYQDSLSLYNKNKKAYESGIETKPKGLKYENAIKGNTFGNRFYLKEGTPIDVVKKPKQPVKYEAAKVEVKSKAKGTKRFFYNDDEVDEATFNKIVPKKGEMQMGGSMPGSVGFMYARTQNPAPSNGKYTKKTQASAQNGQEMKYYQDGLDFKPKSISKNGKKLGKAAMGKSMVNKQLHQLTEWDIAPKYYNGGPLDTSIIKSYQPIGMPNMDALSGKLSNTAFQQQAIKQVESVQPKVGFDWGGAGVAAVGALPGIISGVGAIQQQATDIAKADRASRLATLANQAAGMREKRKRKYVRPEDALIQPGQLGSPYGSGTNYLAENGTTIGGNPTEIQNMYNPGDMYTDAGYEPIESQNLKQYKQGGNLPKAELGEYFQDSGQAQIGSSVGTAAGTLLGGPLGGMVGGLLGKVVGNLFGGAEDARRLKRFQDKASSESSQAAWQGTMQNQFGAYLKDGGWVSNDWQPQTFTKFGEYSAKQLLAPPHDADMLRAGGHLREYTPPSAEAMFTGKPELKPLTMDNGGRMRSTNMMFDTDKYPRAEFGKESDMSGDLQVIEGGKAETISYNPYLPDGGETVMFKGRSHDNGGIPINFGENGVEVEGGEPAVKLGDGGNASNMVVFGNMKLSKMAADEFGIPDAKGKKFKHVANEISKVEKKQNKLIDQATERADMTTGTSGFDQLKLNTSQAQLMGANMKLKSAALLKQNLAAVQNAILDTASELGVKSDELAQGKIVKEKDPRMMAETGKNVPYSGTPFTDAPDIYPGPSPRDLVNNIVSGALSGVPSQEEYIQIPYQKGIAPMNLPQVTVTGDKLSSTANLSPISEDSEKAGFDWKGLGQMALSNIAPFLRPRTNLPLDADQLIPEYFALGNNQLEAVQAQTFQPMLDTPMDISLNDQLNAIDAQSRAAIRAAGSNPSAQAMIMSQTLEAKNKVLGEQTRINAANKIQTYDKNRALINDAQLKNLQILDQQYVRQAQAKSNTKAQALEALKSIAVKTAQNKLENKTLNVYENMYGYRFSPSGVAYNTNAPAQFNIPDVGAIGNLSSADKSKIKELYEKVVSKDKTGNITGSKEKSRTTKQNRNGSIVQAIKNL